MSADQYQEVGTLILIGQGIAQANLTELAAHSGTKVPTVKYLLVVAEMGT